MNRRVFLILTVVVLFIALAILALSPRSDSGAPRFVPVSPAVAPTSDKSASSSLAIPPFTAAQYNWLSDVPFQNDRMWFWINSRPHVHTYLYDLRQRAIIGELFNGGEPEFCSRDGSRILVTGYDPPVLSFKQRVVVPFLKRIGIRLPSSSQRSETFWVLDISSNSAERLGTLWQYVHSGSRWHASPDFRYGYTMPTTTALAALFVCDLEQRSLSRIAIHSEPRGWWDDHDILIENGANQFDLLDIRTQTTRRLFNAGDFQNVLIRSGITNDIPAISATANWNGSGYEFYFGIRDQLSGLKGTNSFLLKASAASPRLELVDPHFQFRWGGYFDHAGKRYLFQGESGLPGQGGNGGVYLRDLASGAISTVVPPDNKGQYAIPKFYGNEVIYFHNRLMHRVGLDGSNDVLILSPPGK